jgi:hypothetical protein
MPSSDGGWRDKRKDHGGIYASVPGKLGGALYCGFSAEDSILGDTLLVNVWLDNQIGFAGGVIMNPHRPDRGADDLDWDHDDMFDEDLPKQIDSTVSPNVIRADMRRWAELSFYFCDLRYSAGHVGIDAGTKYSSTDTALMGINGHTASGTRSLDKVWLFWGWVEGSIGP